MVQQEEIRRLQQQAEDCIRRAEACAGQPDPAQVQLLRALKLLQQLLELTREQRWADSAGEICLQLTDLSMQQGNMHGADVCYARAMCYARGLWFPEENRQSGS